MLLATQSVRWNAPQTIDVSSSAPTYVFIEKKNVRVATEYSKQKDKIALLSIVELLMPSNLICEQREEDRDRDRDREREREILSTHFSFSMVTYTCSR